MPRNRQKFDNNTMKYVCEDTRFYVTLLESVDGSVKEQKQHVPNRMVNFYDVMKRIPPYSVTNADLKHKIALYCVLAVVLFHIAYIFSEIDFPIVSEKIRYDGLAQIYPYIIPTILLLMATSLTFISIDKSKKIYCQMNPDSDKEVFFGLIQLDCIEKTQVRVTDTEYENFLSMSKCGLGMICKYCKYPDSCDDPNDESNWRRMEAETSGTDRNILIAK
jgi:hypothetical protein